MTSGHRRSHFSRQAKTVFWTHQDNHLASIISGHFASVVNFSYYVHENSCILVAY